MKSYLFMKREMSLLESTYCKLNVSLWITFFKVENLKLSNESMFGLNI